MATKINTGGLKSFDYSKEDLTPDPERERSIEEGYKEYYKRKKKERIIKISIVVLVLVMIGLWMTFG